MVNQDAGTPRSFFESDHISGEVFVTAPLIAAATRLEWQLDDEDWERLHWARPQGRIAIVTDVTTGKSWRVQHAKCAGRTCYCELSATPNDVDGK
jgi:hypothetical protein